MKYWELARREQNDLCSERAENELQNSIDRCNNEIITEYRVSNEEKNFLLEEEKVCRVKVLPYFASSCVFSF